MELRKLPRKRKFRVKVVGFLLPIFCSTRRRISLNCKDAILVAVRMLVNPLLACPLIGSHNWSYGLDQEYGVFRMP